VRRAQSRARRAKGREVFQVRADEYLQLSMTHQQSVTSYEAKLAEVREQIQILRAKADERDLLFEEKCKSPTRCCTCSGKANFSARNPNGKCCSTRVKTALSGCKPRTRP